MFNKILIANRGEIACRVAAGDLAAVGNQDLLEHVSSGLSF